MNHTDGPWFYRPEEPSVEAHRNGYNFTVAMIGSTGSRPEMHANARLIAAAPELLEALRSMLQWHRRECLSTAREYRLEDPEVLTARAAIVKATNS